MDSIIQQKCDFKFDILIHDDASTDGTQDIIKEYQEKYPDIVKPIFQSENQWSKGVKGIMLRFNFPRSSSKYIALCEGDDYWTDPFKLKKQVDFLETNPQFSFNCGGYISENSKTFKRKTELFSGEGYPNNSAKGFDIPMDLFFDNWVTKTLTVMLRRSCLNPNEMLQYKHLRDVHLIFTLLKSANGYYSKEILGVYNIHEGGIFSMVDEVVKLKSQYIIRKELYLNNKRNIYAKNAFSKTLKTILNKRLFKEKEFSKSQLILDYIHLTQNFKDLKTTLNTIFYLYKN